MRKANRVIGILSHLTKFLPLKTLDQMYKSLVRSHFDYCDIIYHIPPNVSERGPVLPSLMEKVEKVQYSAALAITGAWKGSSRLKIYEELGWESLSDRRLSRRILQMHKIIDSETADYLKEKLPPNRSPFLRYVFQNFRCKTDRYKNSFFPNAISLWNEFITHFEDFPSYAVLRSHLHSFFRPKLKSIFGLNDKSGISVLFQLRLGLSSLKAHKKRHNFVDTPSAICECGQGIETTNHFLLHVPCMHIFGQDLWILSTISFKNIT